MREYPGRGKARWAAERRPRVVGENYRIGHTDVGIDQKKKSTRLFFP